MAQLAKPKKKSKPPAKEKENGTGLRSRRRIQTKLGIGPAHDRFEAEADRVAQHVVNGYSGTLAISSLTSSHTQRTPKARKKKSDDDGVDEGKIQRSAAAETASTASPAVERGIGAARGGGRPLSGPVRQSMESGLGRDFGNVRIHDDSRASTLNSALSSRAFTIGSDVFFSRGEYQPTTREGQSLLAHELTHVVQQTAAGGIQTKRIQRNNTGQSTPGGAAPPTTPTGPSWTDPNNSARGIDLGTSPPTYRLPELKLPQIAGKTKGAQRIGTVTGGTNGLIPTSGPFTWTGKGSREGQSQTQIWDSQHQDSEGIVEAMKRRFAQAPEIYRNDDESLRVYYVRIAREDRSQVVIIGTADELAQDRQILRPTWDHTGHFNLMEVDHWREIQLGGSHEIDNLWLLDKDANGRSGSNIKTYVMRDLRTLFRDARAANFFTGANAAGDVSSFKTWPDNAHIVFGRLDTENLRGRYWDKERIADGDHIRFLRALNQDQLRDEGFVLGPNDDLRHVNLFLSETSAFRRRMRVRDGTLQPVGYRLNRFIQGFDLQEALYSKPETLTDGQRIGSLRGSAFGTRTIRVPQGDGTTKQSPPIDVRMLLDVPIISKVDLGYGGYIDRAYINQRLREGAERAAVLLPGFSPVSIESAGLNDEWKMTAEGRVVADLPLFPGFEFSVRAEGNAIFIDAPVPVDKLQFDPFRVTEASLQVGYDDQGPFFGGEAAFVIDGVGEGSVQARRLSLAGSFNFDLDAFDPAQIDVRYEAGQWFVGATLGFKENTIPGVTGGEVSVSVGEDGFSLSGHARLGGPGLPEGTELVVAYEAERGLTIGGTLPIDTDRIPGVRSAQATVVVTRTPEGDWTVNGGGSADIELPGVTGSLSVSYENGLLTMNGVGTISRPPLTGNVAFTATNAPADAEGNPVEGEPLNRFRVFGSGSASIQFGRYITGTAGITLLENGEIELMGRIALPPVITLIEEDTWNYPILDFPQVRFPIIGFTIPVIRRSFGVFGYVGGGLDAVVTVGPGELRDSEVEAIYNPDHPEEMSITGGSTFEMRAGAEVGLSVVGGIGAGLGIIEATGEIGIRAGLGLELTGGASVQIAWTPIDGLELDASIFGEARPKFSINLIADARVVVDAFLWSGTLWNEDWDHELGSFGPNMFWRAALPASWSERDGLDLNINNLEIHKPDISIRDIANDVFEAVV